MHIGFLHSIIRPDEKMLLSMFADKGVDIEQIDVRTAIFDFSAPLPPEIERCSLILERAVSFSKGSYALQVLESKGKKTLNKSQINLDEVKAAIAKGVTLRKQYEKEEPTLMRRHIFQALSKKS